jgi:hypothetical protein
MTASLWILSAILGLRHAFEPDHMAAVATLMSGTPRRPGAAARLGASWGFGHGAALLAMATLLAVAQSKLHRSAAATLELLVGAMLIVLGGVRVAAALRGAPPAAETRGAPGRAELLPRRASFSVGIVHGLAGSGALTVLAASQVSSTPARLAFVATFGVGSIVGMVLLSGAAGGLLARLAHRPAITRALSGLAGAFSIGLGIAWLAAHAAALAH